MSVEVRLKKPLMVFYLEPKIAPAAEGEIPCVELQLRQRAIRTFADAVDLERALEAEANHLRQTGIFSDPRSCLGSVALQMVQALFLELGQAEKVEVDDAVKEQEREEPEMLLPPEMNQHWLAQHLGDALGLPVEGPEPEKPEWITPKLKWDREAVTDLVAFHGKSARADVVHAITAMAKKLRPPSALAIGVLRNSDTNLVIYFKVRTQV